MASRRSLSVALVALALAGLAGCAGRQEWIYEKARATPAQVDRDKAACRKVAPSRSMFRTFEDERVDREPFNRCMEKLGYTVTTVPRP